MIAELIKDYLEEAGHHVCEIGISYEQAVAFYHQYLPDLIILDIRLYGEKSGIEFAQYLNAEKITTPAVFLSSQYDQRTLSQVLDTHPYGYLTKPISKESLWTTVSTAFQLYKSKHKKNDIQLFDGKVNHMVAIDDIVMIEANHVYILVELVSNKIFTVRESLKQFLQALPEETFIQCHRSYVVNKHHIISWNTSYVALDNGKQIPISRHFKDKFNVDI
ncbi:MAG: response regulator transcription factor [Saprospiraceae bacterium]|nr:response regulator transcription factor [Saprospiraceae bacterium]